MKHDTIRPIAIAKFSEEKYIDEIINNEELFFNPIEYFIRKENGNYRFDHYEGCDKIYQPSNIVDFKIDDRSYKLAKNGNPIVIRLSTTDYFTHICCFTYFTNKIIIRKNERKVFNPRLFSFGSKFLICMEINQFIEIIGNACKSDPDILKWQIGPVEYHDVKKHNGEWDIFHKPIKYQYQNELRIAITINSSNPYKLSVPGLKNLIVGTVTKEKCINKIINDEAILSE